MTNKNIEYTEEIIAKLETHIKEYQSEASTQFIYHDKPMSYGALHAFEAALSRAQEQHQLAKNSLLEIESETIEEYYEDILRQEHSIHVNNYYDVYVLVPLTDEEYDLRTEKLNYLKEKQQAIEEILRTIKLTNRSLRRIRKIANKEN